MPSPEIKIHIDAEELKELIEKLESILDRMSNLINEAKEVDTSVVKYFQEKHTVRPVGS